MRIKQNRLCKEFIMIPGSMNVSWHYFLAILLSILFVFFSLKKKLFLAIVDYRKPVLLVPVPKTAVHISRH